MNNVTILIFIRNNKDLKPDIGSRNFDNFFKFQGVFGLWNLKISYFGFKKTCNFEALQMF